jgi:mono/diheme cytochrome c family protein
MKHAAVTKLWLRLAAVGGMLMATGAAHADEASDARLKRGDYLVTRAIGCAHCHTPRDADGRRLPGRDLTGAVMQYAPIKPVPNWAPFAPAIAGLPPGYTETQMATFMETGLKPDGKRPRPPMPPFQLDREDALAIAAYLASLKPSVAR